MSEPGGPEPTRLSRRLGTFDAVVVGLGAMIGAGVFAAVGPAAAAAGSGLLLGLAVAAAVAYCNATSSARLAALHPESGGAYVYGRERLGPFWGYLAGWSFVVGKTASCAAVALAFGSYAVPGAARPLAFGAVVALTAVNHHGVRKTAWATRLVVAVVLGALGVVVTASLLGGEADVRRLGPVLHGGVAGVLEAAGLLFFAFAGYARIATLGEEVVDPARTIPRAIPIALAVTVAVYAAVAASALLAVGPETLAAADAPLVAAVDAGSLAWLAPGVRVGAAVASLGVLLSLLVGVSRTAFAMAADRHLPAWLAAVHPRHRVPHRAGMVVGALVAGAVLVADLRGAIGFSSFAVLFYYGVTNAAALTLTHDNRRRARPLAWLGLAGCGILAFSLPPSRIAGGVAVLALGALVWAVRRRASRPGASPGRPAGR